MTDHHTVVGIPLAPDRGLGWPFAPPLAAYSDPLPGTAVGARPGLGSVGCGGQQSSPALRFRNAFCVCTLRWCLHQKTRKDAPVTGFCRRRYFPTSHRIGLRSTCGMFCNLALRRRLFSAAFKEIACDAEEELGARLIGRTCTEPNVRRDSCRPVIG